MGTELDVDKLERKVYASFQQDGLLDLGIGLLIVSFGVSMAVDMAYLPGIVAAAGLPAWQQLRKRFVTRRLGHVSFGEPRQARLGRERGFYLLFFSATALLGVVAFLGFQKIFLGSGGGSELLRQVLRTFVLSPIAVVGALLFVTVGYWRHAPRFYAYAAWSVAVVFGAPMVGVEPPVYAGIWGAGIAATGVVLLVRFVRLHPRPPDAAHEL